MMDEELDNGLYVPRAHLRKKKIHLSKLGKFFAKCMKKSTAKRLADKIEYYFSFISIIFTWPTQKIAHYCIPNHTKPNGEFSYIALVTLILSFVWIAIYSFFLTNVVDRWTSLIEEANVCSSSSPFDNLAFHHWSQVLDGSLYCRLGWCCP